MCLWFSRAGIRNLIEGIQILRCARSISMIYLIGTLINLEVSLGKNLEMNILTYN